MQLREIPEQFKSGDYQNSEPFRQKFQQWVGEIWQQKDDLIERESGHSG
jgi:hypothetical protein